MVCRESETRDQRESIGEFRESSEKVTEGLAESEMFRDVLYAMFPVSERRKNRGRILIGR